MTRFTRTTGGDGVRRVVVRDGIGPEETWIHGRDGSVRKEWDQAGRHHSRAAKLADFEQLWISATDAAVKPDTDVYPNTIRPG